MTAAVAGAAARGAAPRAAAAGAARKSSTGTATRSTRSTSPRPARRPPSSKGYMDAVAAGDVKRPTRDGGGAGKASATRESGGPAAPSVSLNVPGPVSSGAGVILAILFWTWVGLPFLKGGPAAVKAQLMAKFVNRAPDGSWLP